MCLRLDNVKRINLEGLCYLCLTVFIIVLSYLYISCKRKQFQNITTNVPTIFGLPFIGIAYKLIPLKRFLYTITSYFEELNTSTYCAWLGTNPVLITIDPEIIQTVTSSSEFLNKAEMLYNPINNAIPKGIITSEVTKWKHNRKLINAYFNHRTLISFIPLFNHGSNMAVKRLSKICDNREHKIFDILKRSTLEVAIENTMGIEMEEDSTKYNELLDSFSIMLERIATDAAYSTMGLGFLARTPSYYQSLQFLRNFMNNLIDKRTKERNNNHLFKTGRFENDKDPMSSFLDMALNYCDHGQMQKEDVIIESIGLIGASFETVATAIYSTLVMIAMHPEVQQNLFKEISSLLPQEDTEIMYDHLKQAPYLDMVVAETLRLMPSIPVVGRQAMRKSALTSKIVLSPRMEVIVPIFSLHRSKVWWGPQAHIFNPNNFLPENISKRNPYVYMPFSKGARNCVDIVAVAVNTVNLF
ncbi:probable cytochrome P450 313a4 isoform X2 [Eurosta solidaginis]|uniref:probable cytochrome P450 313a4 isoform X2 n=1 Tax=Eurosta solidaginis TaxID=178769 RepID=UPI0035312AB7